MAPDPSDAYQLLAGLAALDTAAGPAAGPAASDDELVAVLRLCEGAARRLDRILVDATAVLARRGVFAQRGYQHPALALADLLGMERAEARRRVIAAEAELADKAGLYTPAQLRDYGRALLDRLDQDGPTPDPDGEDEPGPVPRSELLITRHRDGGGWIKARYDDPAAFAAIVTVLDARSAPLTGQDARSVPQWQADALAEVCGFVLDHADHLPTQAAAARSSPSPSGCRTWRTAPARGVWTSAAP